MLNDFLSVASFMLFVIDKLLISGSPRLLEVRLTFVIQFKYFV